MSLWFHWWSIVSQLRSACPRQRTFFWLVIVLAALCTRQDLAGVTSFVRALGLRARCYGCLLDFFHSPALCPDNLARLWSRLVLKVHPGVVRAHGRLVVLADGLKKSKCGRQMPAVKLLHQSGESNTKPAFIMGHSCQALAVLARVGQWHQAVPLCARIHEGLVFSNRDQRTLLDKLLLLLASLRLPEPVLLVADAYYASGKIIRGLFTQGGHLVSRFRLNVKLRQACVTRRRRPATMGGDDHHQDIDERTIRGSIRTSCAGPALPDLAREAPTGRAHSGSALAIGDGAGTYPRSQSDSGGTEAQLLRSAAPTSGRPCAPTRSCPRAGFRRSAGGSVAARWR